MKIDNRRPSAEVNTRHTNQKVTGSDTQTASFQDQLDDANYQQIRERFDKLLQIVDRHGEKLKETLDKRDLIEYKKRVKDFLHLIQKEFARTRQAVSWDGTGNLKTYTIIEEIDQNLKLMHEQFIQEQSDVLQIVNRIDEIRGLLLDLYR